MTKRISVLIPAYNEEGKIGKVISELKNQNESLDIIVVDDGSTDKTYEEARAKGVTVLKHHLNFGQWAALRTAFAVVLMKDDEYIITLDADGQHSPENLEKVLRPLKDGVSDIVIGSRFLNEEEPTMSLYRFFGIKFFNILMQLRTGVAFTDCTSGFKASKRWVSEQMLPEITENQYGALESLIVSSRNGAKIIEVPIDAIDSSVSNKGGIKYGYHLLRTIFKTI